MDDILKDSRFSKLVNDPRYREVPKAQRKVKIDKRFQSMFDSEKFKVKYTVDKRGKPINQTSTENLRKYYDLSSEESDSSDEDNEEPEVSIDTVGKFVRPPKESDEDHQSENSDVLKVDRDESKISKNVRKKLRDLETDYARGEGVLCTDSSSDEESSDEGKSEDELEHGWGELDADAETCEDATNRLAVCNMDWDNIKAADLFVLFTSFLPPGGVIKNVTIYPSEFGLKRMKEEELRGPIELTDVKKKSAADETDSDEDENEEGSKYHMEKLRKYQLNRLKYYYAVVVFDSASTANKVYSDCDGIEYESSATKLDLRFIPDDVTFDQEIHEDCNEAPENSRYKPRLFTTTALQQAKVELTWDATNPHRTEFLKDVADGDLNNEDIKNYLACSSSDDDEEHEDVDRVEKNHDNKTDKTDPISKYKALLQEIEETEQKKKNKDMEMEITWGLGLKEKTEELVKKKLNKTENLTPFEQMIEKQKEKKKAKKLERKKKIKENSVDESNEYSSDDVPSDIDMNDPYFAEEFSDSDKKKKQNKKSSTNVNDEEDEKKRAELELLLEDKDDKFHFSLKKIQESEKANKKKRKSKTEVNNAKQMPEFQIDVNDDRFSALFTSADYNIDPTNPNYKKTKAMENLIQEKVKRRRRA